MLHSLKGMDDVDEEADIVSKDEAAGAASKDKLKQSDADVVLQDVRRIEAIMSLSREKKSIDL